MPDISGFTNFVNNTEIEHSIHICSFAKNENLIEFKNELKKSTKEDDIKEDQKV